ncbi:PLP-dependent cysteine synthase family protein [Streptomyces beihaiensis]|uniref:PLP-dependent cysteine synthase family protein n=1 Tax=Streptomyces beihaiensis TaxID=2984495 RepID=A0ABT3U082_9ACTN|nr:PLP-dependent cysteine synthase family protein [Streptomyces beihaiensis]MCX3062722.1 PLP-dependent cysteine synthase family protein [Streptomyces beihaiensis]
MTPNTPPTAAVGNTPVLWIDGYWAKLEGFNFGGIKDRAALHMVERARARGDLRPGRAVVESTSGTLGLGLALAGVHYRHPVHVVTDPGMEPLVARMLAAHGARVHVVDEPSPVGGWQQARVDRVAELMARLPGSWCPNQYHNPDNPAAYAALAAELAEQVGEFDVLVCAVGTGGHSAGLARALRGRHGMRDLELVGVDSVASTVFGLAAGPRLMRGLGSSIHPGNVDHAAFDEIHWVGPAEAVRSARRLAQRRFATGGWSVGAVALVAGWLARRGRPAGTRIVAVFPDGPQRYFDTVFNDEFCAAHGLLDGAVPQVPVRVAGPGPEVTGWAWTDGARRAAAAGGLLARGGAE